MKVFIHGFMGDASDFDDVIDEDSIVLELPFHGTTGGVVTSWEEAVEHLRDQLPESTNHLIGYSMGGRIALGIAASAEIKKVTLIAANPGRQTAGERAERLQLDRERAETLRQDPSGFLEEWKTLELFGPQTGAVWARYDAREKRPQQWADALDVLTLANQPDYSNVVKQHDVRFIVGSEDEKYQAIAVNHGLVPEVIHGAWHAVHRDQPARVRERLA